MTRSERAKLRAALSRLVARLITSGERTTTGEIYERAKIEMADLIEDAREKMMREYVQNMARAVMKETVKRRASEVGLFTDEMQRIQVPRCIALPGPEREMVWASTFDATLNELDRHIQFLRAGAAADMARAKRLRTFHDYVVRVSPDDDPDVPIREILGRHTKAA